MKYKIQNLIDIDQLQNLQDQLSSTISLPSCIIDNHGTILTATAWPDVYARFHRKRQDAERRCSESDQTVVRYRHEANPSIRYRCPHGLLEIAIPIVIDGEQYGSLLSGPFFLEEPDLAYFRDQAQKNGFNEAAYIEAIQKVPVLSQEQLEKHEFCIKILIAVISESGLRKLKEIESSKQIEESEKRQYAILKTVIDGFLVTDRHGKVIEVNDAYCRMSGYGEAELQTLHNFRSGCCRIPPTGERRISGK